MTTKKTLKITYDLDKVDLTMSWLPRRCVISGTNLFLKRAYRNTLTIAPKHGKPIRTEVWMSSSEYLLLQLRGDTG